MHATNALSMHVPSRGDSVRPDVVRPDLVRPDIDRDAEPVSRLARRFRILVHNDDRTPMDFVVRILTGIHRLGVEHAIEVMLEAHRTGCALVRVLGLEEAEFRVERSHVVARSRGFPLTFSIEPE